jgi:paraquat-inducible protein A
VPAVELPLVSVRKFGAEHSTYLFSGIRALWRDDMPLLSVWVALCGAVVPLALLVTLTMLAVGEHYPGLIKTRKFWIRAASALQHWAMPEVQVLAVLVAFVKIGALVHVEPGPGLWYYAAATAAMLFAWRGADLLGTPKQP